MNRTIATLSTTLLALVISLGSNGASASHERGLVRIHIPIHEQGPETLKLKKLIKHQRHLDLDHYLLNAVVVKNGRFSNGYASLRVGHHRSGRFFLPGRENVRIPSPSRANDHWRLRLGPGTQVRMVTVVLEPRTRRQARRYRNEHPSQRYEDGYSYSHARNSYNPPAGSAWRLTGNDRHSKKQVRRLKRTRQELARTRAQLEQTRDQLDHSRDRNKRIKHRKDRLSNELAGRGNRDSQPKGKHRDAGRADRNTSKDRDSHKSEADRKRSVRDLSSVYPRLQLHNG